MSALTDKYINPLTDYGFKVLFGSEPNKDLLIDFLNMILPRTDKIKDLSYNPTEQLGITKEDRKIVYDLYCTSDAGEYFIVEMQKAKQNFFKDRSVYYSTFPIQAQGQKGDWNYKLAAVYTVGILDFIFDEHKNDEELLHIIELKNQRGEVFYKKLLFIYLELPKFKKTAAELTSHFDKWLFVFRHLSNLKNRPPALQERVFKKLFEAAEIAQFDSKQRYEYEESLKHYRDIKNVADTAKEEGREEGREEERLIQEKIKYEEQIATAKAMKKMNASIELIQIATKLPIELIEKL